VESDLPFVSGDQSITVLPGKQTMYRMNVAPIRRGTYKGIIAFVAGKNPIVWVQLGTTQIDFEISTGHLENDTILNDKNYINKRCLFDLKDLKINKWHVCIRFLVIYGALSWALLYQGCELSIRAVAHMFLCQQGGWQWWRWDARRGWGDTPVLRLPCLVRPRGACEACCPGTRHRGHMQLPETTAARGGSGFGMVRYHVWLYSFLACFSALKQNTCLTMHVDLDLHTWDCLIYKMKKKKNG